MSKRALFLSVMLAGPWCVAAPGRAAVAKPEPASPADANAAEQMRKAEQLESEGKKKAASDAYRALVKRYGASNSAPKAQRKVGLLLEQSGEPDKAFDAFATYLTKYPNGDDFDAVVESMFKIGKLYLDGQKRKLMGVPVASSMSRAQEMFETLIKRAPFSKWAPLAQFNVGQAFEKQGKYPEAIAAYQQVVTKYSSDSTAANAQYQIGYVLQKEAREGSYDRAQTMKAREAYEDFVNRHPENEKAPQARENLKQIEGGSAKGTLDVAKYYDKTKQYKAAVIYYNDVIKQQPGTPDAEYAKNRIAQLRAQVGDDSLRAGPERAESGARALQRRKLQAKVDTASRPDYVGPPVVVPEEKIVSAPRIPRLRSGDLPSVEPPLPMPDKLPTQDTGLPKPPE